MFLAIWAACLSAVINCEVSRAETSPMAQMSFVPCTARYSLTKTAPCASRNFGGIYEEFGVNPKAGMYMSVTNFLPVDRVSSVCPFERVVEDLIVVSSLISTFRF